MTQAEFKFRRGNPDVLTSIANLSNDEVFTPPEFANRMLDTLEETWANSNGGANIWEDSSVTFLDPFTKSGVFLREITERLTHGLAKEIPDLQERVNHILTKQVFGIGITQLTALLARRSVYCSKWANGEHSIATAFDNPDGNIWFERTEHTWVGGKDKIIVVNADGVEETTTIDGKCKYCAANQRDYDRESMESYAYPFLHTENPNDLLKKEFGAEVKFDVVIGNPPYQLGQSGGDSVGGFAMPIYQKFVDAAKSLDPHFITMVTPSRWFAGGRGLDDFRAQMLSDRRLRVLIDFPDPSEVFPGTRIEGGVSYFLWDASWKGKCDVGTIIGKELTAPIQSRFLNAYDILVRRNEAIPIVEKVLQKSEELGWGNLSTRFSPIQPFGLRTNFKGSSNPKGIPDPIILFENGGSSFISKAAIPKNSAWVQRHNVYIGRAYGMAGSPPHQIYNSPIVAPDYSACTETYLIAGQFEDVLSAKNYDNYLRTRFVRFLVSLRKNTQDIYSNRFSFVPDVPLEIKWTDDILYKKFDLSKDEIEFIEALIRPMELDNE
ncbi:hypothetical protein M2118_000585 [Aurantimicrobium minutum]|uniref:Eco57I restriction-modification methylase domain-containing protein n=1 Tax=Aurantimicrobium minutum TaxID=708131 RepID=UPI002473BF85|nr:Eco57I restriction-modification methylase domain-containing protein [Aurantimicrobium minutum]MDH6277622.1 hypothetical protein [Aurantimicrobium minutum]